MVLSQFTEKKIASNRLQGPRDNAAPLRLQAKILKFSRYDPILEDRLDYLLGKKQAVADNLNQSGLDKVTLEEVKVNMLERI